jgi:hypothetical protein
MSGVTLEAKMETQRHRFSAASASPTPAPRTGSDSNAGVLGKRSGGALLLGDLVGTLLGHTEELFRRLHRSGLIACLYRAAEWRHKEIERAAYRLLQELDAATS